MENELQKYGIKKSGENMAHSGSSHEKQKATQCLFEQTGVRYSGLSENAEHV